MVMLPPVVPEPVALALRVLTPTVVKVPVAIKLMVPPLPLPVELVTLILPGVMERLVVGLVD